MVRAPATGSVCFRCLCASDCRCHRGSERAYVGSGGPRRRSSGARAGHPYRQSFLTQKETTMLSLNPFYFVSSWAVLALAVLGLAAYKGMLFLRHTRNEFAPHLSMQGSEGARMTAAADREAAIDKLGKILTLVAVVYGLAI